MMKGLILIFTVIAIISAGMIYTLTSKSYRLSREAAKEYNNGNYVKAYELVEEAMKLNKLNRQAISLRPKLRRIVEGNDMMTEANRLYEDAVNKALAGDIATAKLEMSQAYNIAQNVPGLSPSKPAAKELMKKIARDTEQVINNSADVAYNNAVKLIGEGDLLRAYEALSNIDPRSDRVAAKMSDVAYQIGVQRYDQNSSVPSASVAKDALYWFSLVSSTDANYADAKNKIKELKGTGNK